MAREEALKIGKVIADNRWGNSRPIILSKQHIEKQKAWQQIKKWLCQPAKSHIQIYKTRRIISHE